MSTALDSKVKASVKRLLPVYGKKVILTSTTAVTDPTTGIASVTTKTASVFATPPEAFDIGFRFNDVVKFGDLRILIGIEDVNGTALTFTPTAGNTITLDAKVFEVVSVETIYSGEDVAARVLQLRG